MSELAAALLALAGVFVAFALVGRLLGFAPAIALGLITLLIGGPATVWGVVIGGPDPDCSPGVLPWPACNTTAEIAGFFVYFGGAATLGAVLGACRRRMVKRRRLRPRIDAG